MHDQQGRTGVTERCHKNAEKLENAKMGGDYFNRAEHIHAVAAKTRTRRRLPASDHDAHGG